MPTIEWSSLSAGALRNLAKGHRAFALKVAKTLSEYKDWCGRKGVKPSKLFDDLMEDVEWLNKDTSALIERASAEEKAARMASWNNADYWKWLTEVNGEDGHIAPRPPRPSLLDYVEGTDE